MYPMIKKKVLVVSTYPILHPYHGGQKRAKAIFEFYKTNFTDAKYIGVFHRGQYPEWGPDDLPLGDPELIAKVDEAPYASELIAGEAIDKDIHVRSPIAKVLMEYKPNIIHIEQPFPYIGLKPLLLELKMHPKLIFGSQNVEYILKERIFQELKVPQKLKESYIKQTRDLEYELSKNADLVVAVNIEDASSHKKMGALNCVIAMNGIDKTSAQSSDMEYWRAYKEKHKINNILTFVGSGHPPNWEGFIKLIGTNLSFLPDDSKIIVAGGVADYFRKEFSDKKKYAEFWGNVELAGTIEDSRLTALLNVTDLILLPITTQRGSNLKTAEAILSGKKFVATSNTFNGFEEYKNLPNIFIADTQKDFKNTIVKALKADYVNLKPEEAKLAQKVQWEHRLKPMLKAVKRLYRPGVFKRIPF
jgi:hypothetical protein